MTGIKKGDTVIVVAPGPRAEWESCMQRFKEQKVESRTKGGSRGGAGGSRALRDV